MSLLDELAGVEVLVVDPEQRLAYAWFGGTGVNVYDEDGTEVDYFTIGRADGRKLSSASVKASIDRVRAIRE